MATHSNTRAPVLPRASSSRWVMGTGAARVAPRSLMLMVSPTIMRNPTTIEMSSETTTERGTRRRAILVSSARSAAPSKPVRTQMPSRPESRKALRNPPVGTPSELVRKPSEFSRLMTRPTTSRIRVRTMEAASSAVKAATLLIREAIRTPARLIRNWLRVSTTTTTRMLVLLSDSPRRSDRIGARPRLSPVKPGHEGHQPGPADEPAVVGAGQAAGPLEGVAAQRQPARPARPGRVRPGSARPRRSARSRRRLARPWTGRRRRR